MQKWFSLILFAASISMVGCAGSHYRHLPIASAVIVHSCAAAEARAVIGPNSVDAVTITLETGAENGAEGGGEVSAGAAKGTLGVSTLKKTAKSAEIHVAHFPTMRQCAEFGYLPQLGKNSNGHRCLIGSANCSSVDDLPADPAPEPAAVPRQ